MKARCRLGDTSKEVPRNLASVALAHLAGFYLYKLQYGSKRHKGG